MARSPDATQPIISDPELASARLAAIQQTPDAQDRNKFQEHPMNTYARNLLSPMNYQSQIPQGFDPRAAPADQRGGSPLDLEAIGRNIAGTHVLPFPLPFDTPTLGDLSPIDFGSRPNQEFYGKDTFPADTYQKPISGGLGRVLSSPLAQHFQPRFDQIDNPLNALAVTGGLVGPVEEGAQAVLGKLGQGARELMAGKGPQFLADAAGEGRLDLGLGGGVGKNDALRNLHAAEDAHAEKYSGATPFDEAARTRDLAHIARLRTVAEQAGADVTPAAALPAGNLEQRMAARDLASRQAESLRASGASEAEIADFAKTMAPPPEKTGIQTAEGQPLSPSVLTRALQTAAGSEGVPLSQHPVFSPYGTGGAKVGPKGPVGGDIGTATRAVMSGDPQAMELLGPDLSQQLIQNKIAHIIRQTGAPEDVVRIGLSVLNPAERAAAEPAVVATVGRNAKVVDQTLADVVALPKSMTRDEINAARQDLADRMGVDATTGMPLGGEGAPPVPPRGPSGGAPSGPPPVGPTNYGRVAGDLFDEVNALWRATLAGADVSTVGLQGAPLIVKEITKLPFYAVTGKFGGTQRPYLQTAFGRFFQAAVSGEAKMRQMTQGFMDQAEQLGLRVGKDIQISDPLGGISAREELTAGKIIQKIPAVGLLYRQANFATITLLNALRIGEVTNLKRAFDGMGLAWDAERAGHLANITTGRGDLPGAGGENADQIARWLQRIFFGPRLATSAVQNVTDTILSLRNVAGQVGRKPLNPIDVSRIHTTAAFVATGVGVMKLAEASGLQIGTDPEATDFGRVTLPGGHRLDFWGPFNEEARLVARELALVGNTAGAALGLRPDVKPKYGAKTGDQLLTDYVTGKFGPLMSAGWSVLHGTNAAGQTPGQVVQSTLANPNPLSNPQSIVPAPFTAQTTAAAFDPAQGGQGGAQGLAESAAGALGFSVLPANQHVAYDGFGRAPGTKSYGQDAVFDEYLKFHPGTLLPPPDSTLGSGHNTFPLPAGQREAYVRAVGEQRRIDLGNLIYSDEYQNASKAQQEKMFSAALSKADSTANKAYLKDLIPSTTDPAAIRAAAVTGFHAQGSAKDEAYWIATLDKAGKLTPDVKQAIEESNVTLAGQRAPITVDEYLRHAPLIHEYLSHVPYGTDKSPIGTPQDWAAVAAAHKQKSVRVDELVRSGTAPSLADAKAQQEILKAMPSLVQRNLFLNGTQLENPARKLLATKFPSLGKFVSDPKAPKEDAP